MLLQWNVKLSLFSVKRHAMKTYGGVEVGVHALFSSAVYGGEHYDALVNNGRSHWTGG
jgi:hypothetical protein